MHATAARRCDDESTSPALVAPHFVVVVKSGPTHDLADQLEHHAELLDRLAPGLILTHGPRALSCTRGRVQVVCLECGESRAQRLGYAWRALRFGARAIHQSGLPGLVVSYDPLQSGAIARAIKMLTGSPFLCELNGAFGNRDNHADADARAAVVRQRRQLRFGSRVLAGADGVRLLYDGQLAGFERLPADVPVRRSFDPVPLARFHDLGEDRTVLFVGHPYRRKGVDVLLRAFDRVRTAFPDWRLVVVGHDLARHCRDSGVSLERVDLRPPTNNARLAPLLGRCGIFVLPSRSEAMGRVLLEAAAAGKPRVGTAVDGIPTVIRDGVDGLLVPKEDDAALAQALARLMGSAELRRSLGRAARERVRREFSGERHLEAFAALANAAIERRRRR
jgi:glycosyltransferase involved in cell wall biosynthesis